MNRAKFNDFNFIKILSKNNKGMALLEFVLLSVFVFIFIAAMIEFGSILKSEALLVEAVNKTKRVVETTGELSYDFAQRIDTDLSSVGLHNVEIRIYDPIDAAEPTIQYSTESEDASVNLGNQDVLRFRDNFKIVIRGEHSMKGSSFAGFPELHIPLVYIADGKIEMFKQ